MASASHLVETLRNAEPEVAEGIIREEIERSIDKQASLGPLHQALEQVYATPDHSNPLESAALTCIPLLLSTQALSDFASKKILSLIAEHASAREIILQLEEIVETINNEEYIEDGVGIFDRFLLILRIYATTIPRVKPRKKPLSETLCPVLDRLARVFDLLEYSSLVKGRELLHEVCEVSAKCGRRAVLAEQASTFPSDAGVIKSASVEFLLKGLLGCSEYINPALGASIFAKLYPQYSRVYTSPSVDPQATKYVLLEIWGAYCISASPVTLVTLDMSASDLGLRLGKFVLMTHLRLGVYTTFITNEELRTTSLNAPSNIQRSLERLELGDQLVVQVIQPGLEANAATDAIVPFLLASVPPRHPNATDVHLPVSLSISDPFIAILIDFISPISTLQPSPIVRHIVFLTLSSLFALFKDDVIRLATLLALIEEHHYPQLRSGTISILRDCTVMALSNASMGEASPSLFASPSLLDSVSSVVLSAQPKELFVLVGEGSGSAEKRKDVDEFIHHSPGIIPYMTESLNFYYAVLIADKSNRTEIRSSTKLNEIGRAFLEPIKRLLSHYEQCEGDHPHDECDGDLHAFIHQNALFSVKVSLDRVENQIASLKL